MHESDSIVIIPTYNEKENIEKIIRAVAGLEKCFHILVIDDGSPDGTAAIVHRLMAAEFADRLFIIEREGKLGLGTAYIAGFKWALAHAYEYVFEMDADFSHDPADLPRLYAACHDEGYDVAIGSRYVSGVNVVNWPIGRVLMSYFASKYVRLVTQDRLQDQGGAGGVRQPQGRHIEDERRHIQRGVLRGNAPAVGRLDAQVSRHQALS